MDLKVSGALVALALVVLGVGQGCASTTCEEIRAHRARFDEGTREGAGADARLMIPFTLMDRVIAGRLSRRPPLPIALPTKKLGMPFELSLSLDRVTTRGGATGNLGITVTLGLYDMGGGTTRIVDLELDTEITPRLVPGRPPVIAMILRPQELGALRPRATPAGVAALAKWMRESLPHLVRSLVNDDVAQAVARESLDFIGAEVWPRVKDRLLGKEPLVDARLPLPDLPISVLALSSTPGALAAHITTDLPGSKAVGSAPDELGKSDGRMVLRLSGGTAMALVNRAMARGDVPSRFDGDGKPKPDGVWEARLGWRGGVSPLVVNLWRTTGSCRRAAVGARLAVALQGDKLRVQVREGRFIDVAGPSFASAAAWLENTFGKALAFGFETAALVRFDAGDDQVQLRMARVGFAQDDVVMDLELGVASR